MKVTSASGVKKSVFLTNGLWLDSLEMLSTYWSDIFHLSQTASSIMDKYTVHKEKATIFSTKKKMSSVSFSMCAMYFL